MSDHQLKSALTEFLAECDELLQRVSDALGKMEKQQADAGTVDSLYRDIHTIKGSSQLFGFEQIGEVAHAMESSLDPVRKGTVMAGPALIEALFDCIKAIEKMVSSIKAGEPQVFASLVMKVIPRLIEAALDPFGGTEKVNLELSHSGVVTTEAEPAKVAAPVSQDAPVNLDLPAPQSTEVSEVHQPSGEKSASSALVPAEPSESSSTIRVSVGLLDKLMTLMGEMVLVRNQVLQHANRSDDLEFLNLSQRLDVVTTEIQGEVMKTRMQPIGNVLSKFQRVVRDLAKELNKKIELHLTGMETELDKTLLEAVKDPIMHIVRNSCDHGIENADDRRKSKKHETGKIDIRAYHEGGQVIVEISDDGKGLDRSKLIQKAIERGMITAEKAAQLSERDVFGLIFAPGFSTAAKVTNVSGRGVGMDVVKSNIEKIGGIIELTSEFGKGMTIKLKIPLTLAIVPAMIVRSGQDRFAIPQLKLVELVRVEKKEGAQKIEWLQGKPILRLRGELLPLISLQTVLGSSNDENKESLESRNDVNIVVLAAEGRMFGLMVDEVQDTADIVVKPLVAFLKTLTIYSGATVMGDGSVALILDVNGVAAQRGIMNDASQSQREASLAEQDARIKNELQEFLLFRQSSPTKHAIPLGLVHRLEEFSGKSVEFSGKRRVVRYRNSILPLITLDTVLGYSSAKAESSDRTLSVLVCQKGGKLYGIEVQEILDVYLTDRQVDDAVTGSSGILGNIVDDTEVIVVVDILRIIDEFAAGLTDKQAKPQIPASIERKQGKRLKILFAEDTVFFKRHVMSVLEKAGIEVVHAVNGEEALAALERSKRGDFDLVLTDIEMPQMNGFQLVAAIRNHSVWKDIPVIALTTCFNPEKVAEGKKAGFSAYLEKLAPEVLLRTLGEVLTSQETKESAA